MEPQTDCNAIDVKNINALLIDSDAIDVISLIVSMMLLAINAAGIAYTG